MLDKPFVCEHTEELEVAGWEHLLPFTSSVCVLAQRTSWSVGDKCLADVFSNFQTCLNASSVS